MIILTDAEKDFYKSQHPFTIKKKKKLQKEGRGKLPQHHVGQVWQTQSEHHSQHSRHSQKTYTQKTILI